MKEEFVENLAKAFLENNPGVSWRIRFMPQQSIFVPVVKPCGKKVVGLTGFRNPMHAAADLKRLVHCAEFPAKEVSAKFALENLKSDESLRCLQCQELPGTSCTDLV
ncbi:MAG: hypothetical protein UY41_C0008G0009 [Candidatus Moranbacteria bacterium GW2011_GWE1_49_15]|nr:MAG: hypothetical protein UX75_C0008G0004 [Candidatus Moranbacteria bacterium GW2011_GWE2_47_10]KKW07177.1 MAG: hypothetical protein UY41_C0008G0009 [Candidatus Moranbacteria bacterium GW2011_GWE1_49_15]HBP01323.1 hypothetical protein [Candidatus Moranbacteria bacterium]